MISNTRNQFLLSWSELILNHQLKKCWCLLEIMFEADTVEGIATCSSACYLLDGTLYFFRNCADSTRFLNAGLQSIATEWWKNFIRRIFSTLRNYSWRRKCTLNVAASSWQRRRNTDERVRRHVVWFMDERYLLFYQRKSNTVEIILIWSSRHSDY